MDKILEVSHIQKTFTELHTLEDISLHLNRKEFVTILGPSGCGKSTLFSIIAGILIPDRGEVLIDHQPYTGVTGRVSFMHQKDLLLPWKSILDNVCLPLFLKDYSRRQAYAKAMPYFSLFGLEGFEKYYPGQLSGGMRQRAALLRTLLFTKDIMLLDEPFGGLDALTRQKMQQWLMGVMEEIESSVLLITHDVDEALLLSDRIYVLTKRPAQIRAEFRVDLKRPRKINSFTEPAYIQLKEEVLACLIH
ncbi:ABC-type nitrate/sulfonate/bicarbonate transport system, ATPase component [Tindallia magadiensis]|uniref:ABC-type nitrate/sulfonate/bicarbonate transport system, ATPase component n=1 Tax=Tindallia magadiensis TaxID=69895 RepID=A0A1I3FIU8_9FIRM|nr:ABC transporter ATP-binding protein [Tindallia magadiensis]SFI11124.1 ABC-type nitrate/sulfonate/bicarbonate transport system, ATPase component [Tindallia magadiensis]